MKMVPDPRVPEMGGSSHICRAARAMRRVSAAPHTPLCPEARSAPHWRGHSRHERSEDGSSNNATTSLSAAAAYARAVPLYKESRKGAALLSSAKNFLKSRLVLRIACRMMKVFRPPRSNWVNRRVYLGSP